MRRPLPWWFPIGAVALFAPLALVEKPFFAFILAFAGFGLLVALATDATVAPGRVSLAKRVAPAPVFAIDYDGGTRDLLDEFTGAKLSESWSFIAVQEAGVEVWSLDRDPQRVGTAPWGSFAAASSSKSGRWRTGTVELVLADGRAAYFDVRVRLIDRIRGLGPNASELARALTAHLSPARPDAAHTPPRVRID